MRGGHEWAPRAHVLLHYISVTEVAGQSGSLEMTRSRQSGGMSWMPMQRCAIDWI